jgi:hypothetical protein
MIEVEHLNKTYGSTPAISDVTFSHEQFFCSDSDVGKSAAYALGQIGSEAAISRHHRITPTHRLGENPCSRPNSSPPSTNSLQISKLKSSTTPNTSPPNTPKPYLQKLNPKNIAKPEP